MRLLPRIFAAALTVGGAIAAFATGAAPASSPHTDNAAATAPGYAVEDFNYPNADQIDTDRGILLKRGDGHITLADCASQTGLLEVWSRQSSDEYCFRVTGNGGWLTLELPSVYGIKGNDYSTEVDMTVDSEQHTFQVDKNAWTPVGESTDPNAREYALVEIRATK